MNHLISKFGHYEAGGRQYLLKADAVRAAGMNPSKVQYYWNDQLLDQFDWTQEPEPNVGLNEFYHRRAQQLRDKYDYLVLLFSGGPDSSNMLEAFVNNGIHIDEIVNINSIERTGKIEGTMFNQDYVWHVKPTLDSLIKLGKFTGKVTVLDEVDLINQHRERYLKSDVITQVLAGHPSPGLVHSKGIWPRYVPHLWSMIVSGHNVGIVMGADKTMLFTKDGKHYTCFNDLMCQDQLAYSSTDADFKDLDITEFFYHSPDCVPLMIKQAQLLKKFIDLNPDPGNGHYCSATKGWKSGDRPHCIAYTKVGSDSTLKYDTYHKIVYPSWTPRPVTPKPTDIIRLDLNYFFVWNSTEAEKAPWLDIIKSHVQDFKELWTAPKKGLKTALPLMHSKHIFLE
jgi:hypothetical protein